MKKKIAFLMAALMAFAAVPAMSLSAASASTSIVSVKDLPDKSLFTTAVSVKGSIDTVSVGGDDVEYVTPASDFVISVPTVNNGGEDIPVGYEFQLLLTNAIWKFAEKTGGWNLDLAADTTYPAYNSGAGVAGYDPVITSKDGESYTNLIYKDGAGNELFEIYVLPSNKSRAVVTIKKDIIAHASNVTTLKIPVIAYMEKEGVVTINVDDQESSLIYSNHTNPLSYNTVSLNSGTKVSIGSVKAGRTKVELDKITIEESTAAIIKNGLLQIKLTDGYQFIGVSGAKITSEVIKIAGDEITLDADKNSASLNAVLTDEGRTLTINLTGISSATTKGKLFITGLAVMPTEDTLGGNYYGTTVKATFKGVDSLTTTTAQVNSDFASAEVDWTSGSSRVKEQEIDVAKFADYGVTFAFDSADAKVTEAYSGKAGIKAGTDGSNIAKIKVAENTATSWIAERALDFTLTDADGNVLDGIKFDSFEITNQDNTSFSTGTQYKSVTTNALTSQVRFKRDKVTVSAPSAINSTKLGSIKVRVGFNAAANFTGDVYLTISGFGVSEKQTLKVATVSAPITVKVEKTNIAIGYQSYGVGKITVTENAKGVLAKNKNVDFIVREFANYTTTTSNTKNDITFNPIKGDQLQRTAGDIGIKEIKYGESIISAIVSKESTEASTLELSGLQVKVYHNAPYGTYDLVVGGNSWVDSYKENSKADDATFSIEGLVVENYIDITTPGAVKTTAKNIEIAQGATTAIVDGKEVDMGIATYIDPATNRTMLPLRAVSKLFGISDENVIWTPSTGTATIIIGERIVTFTEGSSKMTINNVPVDMADENGVAVKAVINPENGRTYIPLRQLGIAFSIDVLWIPSNPGVAVFNPTQAQKDLAANVNSAPVAVVEAETEVAE